MCGKKLLMSAKGTTSMAAKYYILIFLYLYNLSLWDLRKWEASNQSTVHESQKTSMNTIKYFCCQNGVLRLKITAFSEL